MRKKLTTISSLLVKAPFHCISNFDDVNDKFYFLKKLALDVIDSVAPIKSKRIKTYSLPWFDNDLRESFSKRDKLHALALSLRTEFILFGARNFIC